MASFTKKNYQEYRYKERKTNKKLTPSEIEKLQKTQKRVVPQVATGLRVTDLFKIKPQNIIKKQFIRIRPTKTITTKTDNTINIPLNRYSKEILEELRYDSSRLKISSQKYNTNIKELFKVIGQDDEVTIYEYNGLNKPKQVSKKKWEVMTSHNMRDSFISMAVKKGISIPLILEITGQSSYDVMKRYIDINEKDLVSSMDKIFK